jgi:hypothetical protein
MATYRRKLYTPIESSAILPVSTTSYSTDFKPDWLFDYSKMEFVSDVKRGVELSDGWFGWRNWCIKQLYIIRYSKLAYDSLIGIEELYKTGTREEQKLALIRTVTDALMVNPKTKMVSSFNFTDSGDECSVTFTVTPIEGLTFNYNLSLNLMGGSSL